MKRLHQMSWSRFAKPLRTGMLAAGILVLLATGTLVASGGRVQAARSASALSARSAQYAAEATSYQNTMIARAMARQPGGIRLNSSQVAWEKQQVVMVLTVATAPTASTGNCPNHYACIYENPDFEGCSLQFSYPGPGSEYISIAIEVIMYCNTTTWLTESYVNNRAGRTWLNESTSSNHGISYCMNPNSNNRSMAGPYSGDQWLLLTQNTATC